MGSVPKAHAVPLFGSASCLSTTKISTEVLNDWTTHVLIERLSIWSAVPRRLDRRASILSITGLPQLGQFLEPMNSAHEFREDFCFVQIPAGVIVSVYRDLKERQVGFFSTRSSFLIVLVSRFTTKVRVASVTTAPGTRRRIDAPP